MAHNSEMTYSRRDDMFRYAPFSSAEVREATSSLIKQVLPDAHEYDLLVIDDTSARLLGKVTMYALNHARKDAGLPKAHTRFLADANGVDRLQELWPEVPRTSTPLIITESIDTGAHTASMFTMLKAAGFRTDGVGILSIDVRGSRFKAENRRLFEMSTAHQYYPAQMRTYIGDEFILASREGMAGVTKLGGAFAVRANLVDSTGEFSDVPYIRAVREDCKVLARQIVTEYFDHQ